MAARKKAGRRLVPLLKRSVSDDNFAHTVMLMGGCAAWAENITENQPITFNDRNMIQIPVEVALAFMEMHAKDDTALGTACRTAFEHLTAFRQINGRAA